MDYNATDSSGTDDDLPPTHQNRYGRNARVAMNGRSAVGAAAPYPRMHNNDMEPEIHNIEKEAYYHVLRAFKAQSDAITWEKEGFITELRKELRVSDDEHRELLSRVNSDDTIRRISEWRKSNGFHSGGLSSSQPVHEPIPSPTVSASRKKPKTGHSAGSLSVGPPPSMHHSMQPTSSALKRGPPTGGRGKKPRPMLYQPTAHPGRPVNANRGSAFGSSVPHEAANYDPLIGRKVWTRWPDDKNFYEAVITDFKEGRHALVYDMNTPAEAWEWVDLKDIPPQDIKWEGDDPGISQRGSRGGQSRGSSKKPLVRGGAVSGPGRGRGTLKGLPKKDVLLPQNGIGRKGPSNIELLHTDTLIKEVEKVFSGSHPDPTDVEKAKKVLKEHEQALIEAIARLEDASDGESDEKDNRFSQGHPMDRDIGWRKRSFDDMRGDGRGGEGQDGDKSSMLQKSS